MSDVRYKSFITYLQVKAGNVHQLFVRPEITNPKTPVEKGATFTVGVADPQSIIEDIEFALDTDIFDIYPSLLSTYKSDLANILDDLIAGTGESDAVLSVNISFIVTKDGTPLVKTKVKSLSGKQTLTHPLYTYYTTLPQFTVAPSLTGISVVGEDLTLDIGQVEDYHSLEVEIVDTEDNVIMSRIPYVDAMTYTLVVGDVGKLLVLKAYAINNIGTQEEVTAAFGPITAE